MTLLLRVNISCPHCFKLFIPFLVSNADFDYYLITDIDSRIIGLPGGTPPVFIGVYPDGDMVYFENLGDPILTLEAMKMLRDLVDREIKEKSPQIPHDFAWIIAEIQEV